MSADAALEVAALIGHRLVGSAMWDGERCTWEVNAPSRDVGAPRWATQAVTAAGELYQGTSGIALFLAELARRTGDARAMATAVGAMRHAIAAAATRFDGDYSFYSGRIGVAYAAALLAPLCSREEFAEAARDVIARARGQESTDQGLDLIAGAAGAIPPLLFLARELGEPRAAEMAMALGQRILATAHRGALGWSWGNGNRAQRQDLCGYAHGASGFSHALLELHAATGEGRWLFGAEQATRYEDAHFDSTRGNWPDFRHYALGEVLAKPGGLETVKTMAAAGRWFDPEPLHSMTAWCHGAPGIGLARLRGRELVGDEWFPRDLEAAMRATADSLREPGNCSLCHGHFGNADVLLEVGRALGVAGWVESAVECAARWMPLELEGRPWPGGNPGGRSDASLLLGDAGIGYFLLRVADPSLRSVLFVRGVGAPTGVRETTSYEHERSTDLRLWLGRSIHAAEARSPAGAATFATQPGAERQLGPVRAAVTRLRDLVEAAGGGAAASDLRTAAAVDFARVAVSATLDDAVERYRASLGQLRDHASRRYRLADGTRLVEVESEASEGAHAILVHRHESSVLARPVTGFAALVLDALRDGAGWAALVARIARRVDVPRGAEAKLAARLAEQLASLVAAGIVVAEAEVDAPIPGGAD